MTQLLDSQHLRSRSQENSKAIEKDSLYIRLRLSIHQRTALGFPLYASIAQTNLPFTSYNVLFCNLRSCAV